MKLSKLTIKNFKSLGDVTITPSNITVIIGPNGSGKTNLANAFAFLREVYASGLEAAVQKSGGFENIVSASSENNPVYVDFGLSIETHLSLITLGTLFSDMVLEQALSFSKEPKLNIQHTFFISSEKSADYSLFHVLRESFRIKLIDVENGYIHIERTFQEVKSKTGDDDTQLNFIFNSIKSSGFLSPQRLLIENFPLKAPTQEFQQFIENWAVYQLLPNTAKTPGVPTPNPTLSLYGNNLPVLVDHLIRKEKETWQGILSTMQQVVPTLTDITTGYLYNKTVGLFFHEEGFERPWNAEEVSDGTILALAMLCSVNDPRSTLVFIEEPENSLHPWVLRNLVDNFKQVAHNKNIFITTHSPTLIDMFAPNDIWCISKSDRQTKLNRLTDIATELQSDWEEGRYKISDYLDAGLVPQAIPGGSL